MTPEEQQYAEWIGQWVTNRIVYRLEKPGESMPQYVIDWLAKAGKSAPPGDVCATYTATGWIFKSVAKDDWPEPAV